MKYGSTAFTKSKKTMIVTAEEVQLIPTLFVALGIEFMPT